MRRCMGQVWLRLDMTLERRVAHQVDQLTHRKEHQRTVLLGGVAIALGMEAAGVTIATRRGWAQHRK